MKTLIVLLLLNFAYQSISAQCISGNCVNGYGKKILGKNTSYEGNFLNSLRHGEGTLSCVDGSTYIGNWKNDKRDNFGKYTDFAGREFSGRFNNDIGTGHMTFLDDITVKGFLSLENKFSENEAEFLKISNQLKSSIIIIHDMGPLDLSNRPGGPIQKKSFAGYIDDFSFVIPNYYYILDYPDQYIWINDTKYKFTTEQYSLNPNYLKYTIIPNPSPNVFPSHTNLEYAKSLPSDYLKVFTIIVEQNQRKVIKGKIVDNGTIIFETLLSIPGGPVFNGNGKIIGYINETYSSKIKNYFTPVIEP